MEQVALALSTCLPVCQGGDHPASALGEVIHAAGVSAPLSSAPWAACPASVSVLHQRAWPGTPGWDLEDLKALRQGVPSHGMHESSGNLNKLKGFLVLFVCFLA